MTESYEVHEHPELHEPVLVVMLQGWIDAGNAAANAMTVLDSQLSARLIASFHPDKFIDHRARRPVLQIRDGVNVGLQWPEIVLKAGKDAEGRDALLLMGAEPDMNWHAFCDATVELAAQFEVSMMVGLGAYPIAVPHSRPSRLSVSASNEKLARRASYFRNSVDVPAGIERGAGRGAGRLRHPDDRSLGADSALHLGVALPRGLGGAAGWAGRCGQPRDGLHLR